MDIAAGRVLISFLNHCVAKCSLQVEPHGTSIQNTTALVTFSDALFLHKLP